MEVINKDGIIKLSETIIVENEVNSEMLLLTIDDINNNIERLNKRKEDLEKVLEDVLAIENKK